MGAKSHAAGSFDLGRFFKACFANLPLDGIQNLIALRRKASGSDANTNTMIGSGIAIGFLFFY
jgi:hypothetical protein